jgi:hypothetical protein
MSHISKIKTQMVEQSLILQAITDLGYKYELGHFEIQGAGGKKSSIDIKVISRFGNDIGLKKNGEFYEIVADWWGVMGTTKKEFTNTLNQHYAYLAVKSKLEQQGFMLASEEKETGKIHLILRRMV